MGGQWQDVVSTAMSKFFHKRRGVYWMCLATVSFSSLCRLWLLSWTRTRSLASHNSCNSTNSLSWCSSVPAVWAQVARRENIITAGNVKPFLMALISVSVRGCRHITQFPAQICTRHLPPHTEIKSREMATRVELIADPAGDRSPWRLGHCKIGWLLKPSSLVDIYF
jgi:hypothetical protein